MSSSGSTDVTPAAVPRWRRVFSYLPGWLPVLIALPLLLWRADKFLPFMADDSLIVARYVERLIEGHGLTWTDGERVEGYSNLLWVVSSAAIGALGVDILDAMRLLGVICMTAVLAAISYAYAPRSLVQAIPPTIAALMFVSAGPVVAWAIGGLEQSMVAALLAWALALVFPILDGVDRSNRRAWLVGVPLALLCWTRPDSPLFVAVFAGVIVLLGRFRRESWGLSLRVTALPVLAVGMQLAFRLIYYGDWLPNPAYIKARVTPERVREGIEYIVGAWEWMVPALVLVGLSLTVAFIGKHQRARLMLLLCCFAGWAAYVISVGGDIFAARRHWVVLWLLLTFMLAAGLDWVIRRERWWLTLIVAIVSLAGIGRLYEQQLRDPMVRLAKSGNKWVWEGEVIARVLGDGFREQQPLLAVTAAGTFPYYSKLPCLDMLGLNDRHIARQRPEQVGDLAHDHADGGYVLDRAPDLMIFALGTPPGYDAGRDIARDPRFRKEYVGVVFRGYEPHERDGLVYVRTRGRVGMQVEDDVVTVPAYLLTGNGVFAQPGVEGGIETVILDHTVLTSRILPVGPGTWQVSLDPPNPDVEIGLFVPKGRPSEILSVAAGDHVRVRVTAGDVGTLLGAIRIERVSAATPSPAPIHAARIDYTTEPLGTFDKGLDGWQREGNSFKQNPASRRRKQQSRITGNVGKFLDSFGPKGGDKPRGSLTSKPFTATPGMVLSFRIGGGKDRRVGVRLVDGERTLISWHGRDSEELEEQRFVLTPYAGRTLHIEVFDEWNGKWGHVLADEFVLLRPVGADSP